APGAGAGLAGRFGGSSSSIAWTWNSSITSAVWRRNSAIALPSERATSGSRFGPSTTSATTRITSSSGIPSPNIGRERREKGGRCQFTAHDPSAIVASMAGGTAVAVDRRMLAHDPGRGHPERPDRLRVLLDHLGDAADLVHLGARAAAEEELALVHPAAHIERVAASAGRARVAIIDWDLHHGNGTQHLFESDPDVLYVSTHQYPYYPGTGAADEVGRGAGAGRTLNLPFPAGFGDAEYVRAFTEVVTPVVRQF